MSKVICDICGTSYPDTAQQCPICGYSRDMGPLLGEDEIAPAEPAPAPAAPASKGGRFSAANVRKRNQASPAAQPQPDEAPESGGGEEDGMEYGEEPRQSNAVLVALLVVVIVALLSVTGYIAFRYYLPNVLPEETTVPVATEEPTLPLETDPPVVPCSGLAMLSGSRVELNQAGQHWLLHVIPLPAGCTDELVFTSADESVATVSSSGRVTAVASGETVITISCGDQILTFTVVCDIAPEATQ